MDPTPADEHETEKELRQRLALEKLRDSIFFLDRREMKRIIEDALLVARPQD